MDGLEEKIMEGADRTLEDLRLKSIFVEISQSRGPRDPVFQSLKKAGFEPFRDFATHSSEQLKGTPYEDCVNTVFIRA